GAVAQAEQRAEQAKQAAEQREDAEYQHREGGANHAEKWLWPPGSGTRFPPSRASTPGPSVPALSTRPMPVSGMPNSRSNAARSSACGAVTISSYSSPPSAASRVVPPAITGSLLRSTTIRTPLAAATCPASAAIPSDKSIAAVAPCAASQRASASLGTG